MEKLCYRTLDRQGYSGFLLRNAPERILQFGEGNFLRAFVDYFVDVANEATDFRAKAVLCQPIPEGRAREINEQDGLYTLCLRGREDGKEVNTRRIVSAVSRCIDPYQDFGALLDCAKNPDLRYIVSNTTEAGIAYDPDCLFDDSPPVSFPAKLTRFLYERFRLGGRGFILLPCELIDDNGARLYDCVCRYAEQWSLGDAFLRWLRTENRFCSTLVDRIVTGYPRAEAAALEAQFGYEDAQLDTAEPFGLWVIEGDAALEAELPFARAGLPVRVVPDQKPYKTRKVRILNGAHTSMVPAAYLCGLGTVRACMEDGDVLRFFRRAVWEEILPSLPEREEAAAFARAVEERFRNPFIEHQLISILLNCASKWRARVLPSVKAYRERAGELPRCLTLSMAAYIELYTTRPPKDEEWILDFFAGCRDLPPEDLARAVLQNERLWGEDLTLLSGFCGMVSDMLRDIREQGMRPVLAAAGEA